MTTQDTRVELTAADDSFHPPIDEDPSWTETCYWAFDEPERNLSLAVYPLFRPNLGVCSLAVHLWDDTASVPWLAPYSRTLWHVPMPDGDLTDLHFEGLTYKTLEPLSRYYVAYQHADLVWFELEFTGHRLPYASMTQVPQPWRPEIGHYDQSMDVRGVVTIRGERIPINTMGHRDRSWYNRVDNKPRVSVSLCFGDRGHDDKFLLMSPLQLLDDTAPARQPHGVIMRDGIEAPVVEASRRVVERRDGMPRRIEIDLTDALGRSLRGEGRARNNFAFQCSPPVFAWFGFFEWTTDDGVYRGEDQEAHGAHSLRALYL